MDGLTVCLTHDVDRVRKTYQYLTKDVRKLRLGRLVSIFNKNDPYWCFDKIMKLEDDYGVRSTFFFLQESLPFNCFKPSSYKLSLGRYSLNEPKLKNIIRQLDEGGWEIGLHGSYYSYLNAKLLKQEKDLLEDVLGKKVLLGITSLLNYCNYLIKGMSYFSVVGLMRELTPSSRLVNIKKQF